MTPIPILLYHSVAPHSSPAYARWCITPSRFADHLDVIRESGYQCRTISQLVDEMAMGTLPLKPLAITFDDGLADFTEHAVDALTARELPATIYVVSAHVGGTSAWLPIAEERDQPMMNWDELRGLADAGIEVGAHSATHPELDVVGHRRAHDEIRRSAAELADGLGSRIRSFAYPHGYHSRRVKDEVRAAGFDSACAVMDRWSSEADDRFALARLVVDGSTTADALVARLSAPPRHVTRRNLLPLGWRCWRWVRQRTVMTR